MPLSSAKQRAAQHSNPRLAGSHSKNVEPTLDTNKKGRATLVCVHRLGSVDVVFDWVIR
jgi:hypothetical protein